MAPSLMIFYCVMGLGQFYIFAAVMAYFMLLVCGLLVLAYKMNNLSMIKTLRILLVLITFCAFMNICVDNMIFSDTQNEELDKKAHSLAYSVLDLLTNITSTNSSISIMNSTSSNKP